MNYGKAKKKKKPVEIDWDIKNEYGYWETYVTPGPNDTAREYRKQQLNQRKANETILDQLSRENGVEYWPIQGHIFESTYEIQK